MSSTEYEFCSKCNARLKRTNVSSHMERVHSPEAENKRRIAEKLKQAKLLDDSKIINCPICKVELRKKNLSKHKAKAHGSSKKHQKAKSRRSITSPDMTAKQKERALAAYFGPDREHSRDALGSGRFVSGGAYGLGKNRKH